MNILLDSHILLWSLAGSRQIPMKARDLIVDESNQIYFSSLANTLCFFFKKFSFLPSF